MMTGRITKDSSELRRVTVDFTQWVDDLEVIASITTAVIVVEQNATWQNGAWTNTPPPPVTDTTPLTLVSSTITDAGLQVRLMLGVGTPGLTYKVTFDATGSVSGRVKQVDMLVTVREPV